MNKLLISTAERIDSNSEGDVIAFDGKTVRETCDEDSSHRTIHMLNALGTERGLCIGHIEVGEKRHEITALPKRSELLDLRGVIVTTDALNTQKDIVKK